jgi:hypothetical protein
MEILNKESLVTKERLVLEGIGHDRLEIDLSEVRIGNREIRVCSPIDISECWSSTNERKGA